MRKYLPAIFAGMTLLIASIAPLTSKAQDNDELAIRKILSAQIIAWNRGSIDDFMQGYWHSDSLMFIGRNGITYGYRQALDNYKKNYSDTAQMGRLDFQLEKLQQLSGEYYFVVGRWHLKRSVGDIGGVFNLLFRKINGRWCIITDHSS